MLIRPFQILLTACLTTSTVWGANDPFVGKFKGKMTGTRQIELSRDLKILAVTVRLVGQDEPQSILVFERE
jgi:hypothetical protein